MREHSLIFGSTVGALVGLNPLVYILGTQITYPAIGMLLVIVGVGGMVHDWFAAIVVILLLDLAWILCAVAFGIPAGIAPATFVSQILKANALAIVLNIARTRTVHRFEQARLEVHRMANTDELTGLANQRGLLEVARAVPDRDDRPGRLRDLAVVYVDVDGLKSVNDAHGHAAGDALIRATGNVLRGAFRPDDTIARVGGDEFAILLDDVQPGLIQELVAGPTSTWRSPGSRPVSGQPARHPAPPASTCRTCWPERTRPCTRPRWPERTATAELSVADRRSPSAGWGRGALGRGKCSGGAAVGWLGNGRAGRASGAGERGPGAIPGRRRPWGAGAAAWSAGTARRRRRRSGPPASASVSRPRTAG